MPSATRATISSLKSASEAPSWKIRLATRPATMALNEASSGE